MLDRYFIRPATVDRIRSSWIGRPVEQYVTWLAERNYSYRSITRRVPILIRFGEFARDQGASEFGHLPDHVEPFEQMWLSERAVGKKSARQRKKAVQCVRNPIQQMLRLAVPHFVGVGRSHKPDNPFGDCAPRFFDYLVEEKGLREASIDQYRHHLRQFCSYLLTIDLKNLAHLSPAVLSAFVATYAQRVGWASLRNACGVLRVFLRYLQREGTLKKDLSCVVEHPQTFRLSGIPRSIGWDDVRRVLETVDRRTPIGRRDYAILLLLVTYGLRAHEVAALTLDDIDWRNDRLRIPLRKAGHSTAFPLSAIVGAAILDYLKNGRPQTQDRRVFFRAMAPVVPIGHAAISTRAGHYLHKAGVRIPRAGSHTLRHTCVQKLVDADFSLKVIGDYLGHRAPASTQIYSKVAIEALRQVALGDGEEVL
jgi:site-specific recombinase XerD